MVKDSVWKFRDINISNPSQASVKDYEIEICETAELQTL